jgi:hypothetical protein
VDCDPVAGVFFSSSLFGMPGAARPFRPTTPTSTNSGFSHLFNERGSLGLFGSGAIELLGREMTDDLHNLKAQAIAQAQATQNDVAVTLQTKGVQFGTLTAIQTVRRHQWSGGQSRPGDSSFGVGQTNRLGITRVQPPSWYAASEFEQLDPPFSDSDPIRMVSR